MARILLIDDDDVFRAAVAAMLTAAGHEVEATAKGSAALAAHAHRPCDVVVTDVLMPEMDGIEILRALRAGASPPSIVMMTGGSVLLGRDFLDAARMLGADATIAKPFNAADLGAAIDTALQGRRP